VCPKRVCQRKEWCAMLEKNIASQDFGKDTGLLHELVIVGRRVGANREFYKALKSGDDLFREAVELVQMRQPIPTFGMPTRPTILLAELVNREIFAGINELITPERFPKPNFLEGWITVGLFRFTEPPSDGQIIQKMREEGFRPSIIEELVMFARIFPRIGQKYKIVALQSKQPIRNGNISTITPATRPATVTKRKKTRPAQDLTLINSDVPVSSSCWSTNFYFLGTFHGCYM